MVILICMYIVIEVSFYISIFQLYLMNLISYFPNGKENSNEKWKKIVSTKWRASDHVPKQKLKIHLFLPKLKQLIKNRSVCFGFSYLKMLINAASYSL